MTYFTREYYSKIHTILVEKLETSVTECPLPYKKPKTVKPLTFRVEADLLSLPAPRPIFGLFFRPIVLYYEAL